MRDSKNWTVLVALVSLGAGLTGCPGGMDEGTLAITVSGEEAAETGYPASTFADGWAVSFSHIGVAVEHVVLTAETGTEEVEVDTAIDLVTENGGTIAETALASGRWGFGYEVTAPGDGAAGVGLSEVLIETMRDEGFGIWVEGTATQGEDRVDFEVGFPVTLAMTDCTNGVDDTDGVVVEAASTTEAEVTAHVEHLFYDKLGGHDGVQFRFDAWAAAAGDDGVVDTDDLESALLADLPDYDPGSEDVDNLHDFVLISVSEMFHLNGEGLCAVNGEAHAHDHEE